jgi:hypothetical protein
MYGNFPQTRGCGDYLGTGVSLYSSNRMLRANVVGILQGSNLSAGTGIILK